MADGFYDLVTTLNAASDTTYRDQKDEKKTKIKEKIREATEIYVANLFRISVKDLRREFIFGVDLQPACPPSLKEDVYEELRFDFLFVADNKTRKLFNSGRMKVNTAEELCNHMVCC